MPQELRNLLWIEELLPNEIIQKRMLGGIGYYLDEKLVLILIESSRTREHKGIQYPFEIWNGCLFPIEKMKQNKVFGNFTFLENHPASSKWLYLPAETEEFEEKVRLLIREIKKRSPLFGTFTKISAAKGPAAEVIDSTKPQLFSDRPIPKVSKKEKPKKSQKKIKANKKSGNQLLMTVLKRRSQ